MNPAKAASALIAGGPGLVVPPITASHPRLFLNAAGVERMKVRAQVKGSPWNEAWLKTKALLDAFAHEALHVYTGDVSIECFHACSKDSSLARDLTLAWIITGEDHYATRAIEILMAWVTAEPTPASYFQPDSGSGMQMPRCTMPFAWAYDLLYDHPHLTPEVKAQVEAWFRIIEKVIRKGIRMWDKNGYYGGQHFQNHVASHTMGMALLGYLLGDRDMVQFALCSAENPRDFLTLLGGSIRMFGQPTSKSGGPAPFDGEMYDRYRHFDGLKGLGYSHLTMAHLIHTAMLAHVNGIDFFHYTAPCGATLEKPFEFYSDFHLTDDTSIKGGYYTGEKPPFAQNSALYELAHVYYPDNESIKAVLRRNDRVTWRDPYFGSPLLTHGEPV